MNEECDVESRCSTGAETYGEYSSCTEHDLYLTSMHSFIADGLHPANHDVTPDSPIGFYTLLNGRWLDGTQITPDSSGYNPGFAGSPTRFLYNGDPRDSSQWSWYQEKIDFGDPRTVSSIYLNTLQSNESAIVETAYIFIRIVR